MKKLSESFEEIYKNFYGNIEESDKVFITMLTNAVRIYNKQVVGENLSNYEDLIKAGVSDYRVEREIGQNEEKHLIRQRQEELI